MIEVRDLVIARDIQLDDILLGEGPVLLGKAGGGLGKLSQGLDGGALENRHADGDRARQQDRHKDEALPEEGIALADDVGHVDVNTRDRDGVLRFPVNHRFDRGEQPSEVGVVDDRRDADVPLVFLKFRDRLLDGADIVHVFVKVNDVVCDLALTVLVICGVNVKVFLDPEKAGEEILVIIQKRPGNLLLTLRALPERFVLRIAVFGEVFIETRLTAHPVPDQRFVI